MKTAILALCVAVSLPLHGAKRRAAAPPASVLAIEFVDVPLGGTTFVAAGSDALVELNTVSQPAGSMGSSVLVRRQFGIRIVRRGEVTWGTAVVTARLDVQDGRSSLRIDGRPVTGVPVVIDARAAVGSLTIHTLEVEIRDSVAAGPLAASIVWEATTQ